MALRLQRGDRAPVVGQATLSIVVGLVVASLLFNAGANAVHAGYPYSSFLSQPDDRFGDFFKLAFSYPGGPIHSVATHWGMNGLLAHHLADLKLFEGTNVNHFHEPPLPTLFALGARWLMSWVDPVVLFLGLLVAVLSALFATVLRVGPPGRPGVGIAVAALLSYPALLAIDRGHFFALICAALVIAATFRTLRGKADIWAILMFAIALNLRPNAGIIPLALLLGRRGLTLRGAVLLAATSVDLFVLALAGAHLAYPAYTFQRFLNGLGQYAMAYGGGENGYANGSSLYGMLRAPLGYAPWIVFAPFIVAAVFLAPAVLESRSRRLRQSEFLFLVLCVYAFGSHVFADYHLLAFIIPLILVARDEGRMGVGDWTIVIASGLMLAPKNFLFAFHNGNAWSWQVVVNPLALLAAATMVLWAAWRRDALAADQSSLDASAAGA